MGYTSEVFRILSEEQGIKNLQLGIYAESYSLNS